MATRSYPYKIEIPFKNEKSARIWAGIINDDLDKNDVPDAGIARVKRRKRILVR